MAHLLEARHNLKTKLCNHSMVRSKQHRPLGERFVFQPVEGGKEAATSRCKAVLDSGQRSPAPMVFTCLSIAEKLQEPVEMDYTQLPPNHKVFFAIWPSLVKYYNQTPEAARSGEKIRARSISVFLMPTGLTSKNPRDGHVMISGPELIPDSLPILEMQEPGHQPLIKQFSDQGGVQQCSINRTKNLAIAQRDVVLGFNPNADINSGDDSLLTQIPAPAAKKMSMQSTEICHSMDHCPSRPLYQPTDRLVSVHSVDSSKSAHREYRQRASYVKKEDYDSTVKGSKQFEILQSVEETESFKISDEHDLSGDHSVGETKMSHMKVVPAEEDITKVEQELHNPSNLGATPAHRTAVGNLPSQAFDSLIVADKPLVDAKTAKSYVALLYSDGRDVVFGNLSCVQTVASLQKCSFSQQEDIMEKHQEAAGIYSVSYADILKRGLNLNDDEEPGSGATHLELP
ncbi:hypothetical protein Nepgr_008679 [Nepenthes gracilis]|uniref:Uncharacterized protein n=1 Tax=Nepenthes gracilis TaxID=150966 RepID=A0AAD3XJI1_NEPGR|nr:hypothetical protein Nepgr_008679 [Nepenthes gracilis]